MNSSREKIYVVANAEKPHVKGALRRILPWLKERAEVYTATGNDDWKFPAQPSDRDCVLVLGGDGSMLAAARRFAAYGTPILGINLGKFGFLTQATSNEAFGAIQKLLNGDIDIEERMMMQCRLQRDGKLIEETVGLNDVVISRTALSRLLTIELFVDEKWVNTYRADGLIVSTPVGSTAHSLAASGPILTPDLNAFVICPICPHTLSNRPIVISGEARINLLPRDYSEQPALTVDGQIYRPLATNDTIEIKRSDNPLKLVRTDNRSFFMTLREKLGWSGQPNYVNDRKEDTG